MIKTCMFFQLFSPKDQYKLKLKFKRLQFPKNNSCMHTTTISKLSSISNMEIVYPYLLPKVCYINNINNLWYSFYL